MNAQAGVIATNPATAPEATPRVVGLPSRNRSTSSQPPAAAAVAIWVFMNARAAVPFAASSEPALKPNHPNHSSPAPSSTSGRLCGRIGSRPQPRRLPRTIASARPAEPALTWTTVPPAKSSIPRLLSQPPPPKPPMNPLPFPNDSESPYRTHTIVTDARHEPGWPGCWFREVRGN
jgi:hypothetical protein